MARPLDPLGKNSGKTNCLTFWGNWGHYNFLLRYFDLWMSKSSFCHTCSFKAWLTLVISKDLKLDKVCPQKKILFLSYRVWFLIPWISHFVCRNFADTTRNYHLFDNTIFKLGLGYSHTCALLQPLHGHMGASSKKVICALNRCEHTDLVLEDDIWTTRMLHLGPFVNYVSI